MPLIELRESHSSKSNRHRNTHLEVITYQEIYVVKFLFAVSRFHTNLYYAVKALQLRGHDVHMIVVKSSQSYGLLEPHKIKRPVSLLEAARLMRRIKPDVLIVRKFGSGWLRLHWLSHFYAAKSVEYKLTARRRRPSAFNRMISFLGIRPRLSITPVAARPPSGDTDYFRYIPFPIESPANAISRNYCPDGRVCILCVGKLSQRRKRHLLLIEILEKIAQKYNFSLTIVGSSVMTASGSSQEYLNKITEKQRVGPLAGRIFILRDIAFDKMADVYLSHDILVLPAIREPLGTVILEAMASGCVPIASDACGAAGYLCDGAGFVVPADDTAELQAKLTYLVSNPAVIATMGSAALNRVRHHHSLDAYADRMEALLKN